VLAHPAVTAAVLGARSPEQVRQNAACLATAVPKALLDELAADGLIASAAEDGLPP
jgi:D-threo-aldose 1-dehydrogenase